MNFLKKIIARKSSEHQVELSASCCGCRRPLEVQKVGSSELERCPDCGGTWMSGELLEQVLKLAQEQAPEVETTIAQDGQSEIGNTFAPSREPRGCPACCEKMENFQFETSGIWIDACPEGHGVWLDRGELKLLACRQRDQGLNSPTLASMADVLLETL